MNNVDEKYLSLVKKVLDFGTWTQNRTGIKAKSIFGHQIHFSLNEGFPILTTKKIFWKGIVHELLWFLNGSINIKYLVDNDVHIWDEWAYKKYKNDGGLEITKEDFIDRIKTNKSFARHNGKLGEGTYGSMWRNFPYCDTHKRQTGDFLECSGVDQIKEVLKLLERDPESRRMIVSAWHPYWATKCALAPCHILFQFNTTPLDHLTRWREYVKWIGTNFESPKTKTPKDVNEFCDARNVPKFGLRCQLYQRSADLFLGTPFNLSSYSLLTHMVAKVNNMLPLEFIWTAGDIHLYENHEKQIKEQLKRAPFDLPRLELNPAITNLFDYKYEDIKLEGYNSHPAIKAKVAV